MNKIYCIDCVECPTEWDLTPYCRLNPKIGSYDSPNEAVYRRRADKNKNNDCPDFEKKQPASKITCAVFMLIFAVLIVVRLCV